MTLSYWVSSEEKNLNKTTKIGTNRKVIQAYPLCSGQGPMQGSNSSKAVCAKLIREGRIVEGARAKKAAALGQANLASSLTSSVCSPGNLTHSACSGHNNCQEAFSNSSSWCGSTITLQFDKIKKSQQTLEDRYSRWTHIQLVVYLWKQLSRRENRTKALISDISLFSIQILGILFCSGLVYTRVNISLHQTKHSGNQSICNYTELFNCVDSKLLVSLLGRLRFCIDVIVLFLAWIETITKLIKG